MSAVEQQNPSAQSGINNPMTRGAAQPAKGTPSPIWHDPEARAKRKAERQRGRKRNTFKAKLLKLGKRIRPYLNDIIGRSSPVGDSPLVDPKHFPWTGELEANWQVIRGELEAFLRFAKELPTLNELSPDHRRIADDHWRTVFLYGYGHRSEQSCGRCPETAKLLDKIPNLETALFSILEPGSVIWPHKGPTKAYITCHLGLKVPQPAEHCFIEIEDQPYIWHEGETLFFDDTYKHAVWNNTDDYRIVLLLHLRRPVGFPGSILNKIFLAAIKYSPFVRDALKNQAAWERRFDEICRAAEAKAKVQSNQN